MSDRDSSSTKSLAPYYPSEVPSIAGNGRRWVAILLVVMLLGGALSQFLAPFL